MITIKNVKMLDGQTEDLSLSSSIEQSLDASGKLLLPALIDPHISLGAPQGKNWMFRLRSALCGGIGTILDIPSNASIDESKQELEENKQRVNQQLADLKIPLTYFPYFKANSKYIEELRREQELTKGSLLLFNPEYFPLNDQMWNRIFQIAAWKDLPIVMNSKGENKWQEKRLKGDPGILLEKAIYYAEKQNARLYVLNVSNQNEMELIQQARARSLLIYAETTLEHLFSESAYQADFLWECLNNRSIETIGSGYWSEEMSREKLVWQGKDFHFLNPIFLLPFLFTAYTDKKITLENIVRLTHINFYDIFKLEKQRENFVLMNCEKEYILQKINPIRKQEIKLTGWPEYVILKGCIIKTTMEWPESGKST